MPVERGSILGGDQGGYASESPGGDPEAVAVSTGSYLFTHELAKLGNFFNGHEMVSWDCDVPTNIADLVMSELPK
jgi:hypothetical protein